MTSTSVDYQRRQELQQRRRHNFYRSIWRSLVAAGLAAGLAWGLTLPRWTITKDVQVEIEGNQFLSAGAIRTLLSLSYPQSIIRLDTRQLVERLQTTAPVANAMITRQLLPPKLTVAVQERPPVAVVVSAIDELGTVETGLLDSQGIVVPLKHYQPMNSSDKPTLEVIGFQSQYQQYWTKLYELISHSPVPVFTVNLQNPSNLILETELGIVHLGSNHTYLNKQLAVLSQLRPLPARLDQNKIVLIDLTNPDSPELQLSQSESKTEPSVQ